MCIEISLINSLKIYVIRKMVNDFFVQNDLIHKNTRAVVSSDRFKIQSSIYGYFAILQPANCLVIN